MATEQDFKKCLAFLFQVEGGFNNVPGDSGGATNHGISLKFLAGTGDYDLGDLDDDGDIDSDDIRATDSSKAAPIYKKYFWDCFPMKEIPAPIAAVLFDVAVNSGPKTAARLLQETLGVKPDGVIGPKTLNSLRMITSDYNFADQMCIRRRNQYVSYVSRNPALSKFLNGWMNRVEKLRKHLFEL
jgi:lysozyme family protein